MRVRSMSRMPNSVIAATSAPGALSMRSTTEVRSAPVAGRRRPGRADQDEAGPARWLRRRHRRPASPAVALRGQRGAHSGVGTTVGHVAGLRPHWSSPARARRRQVLGQPPPHLGGRHRERRHGAHRSGARSGRVTMLNATSRVVLGVDLQRRADGQAVQRRQHRAVDGVLDRHARESAAPPRTASSAAGVLSIGSGRRAPAPAGHQAGGAICSSAASVKVPSGPR